MLVAGGWNPSLHLPPSVTCYHVLGLEKGGPLQQWLKKKHPHSSPDLLRSCSELSCSAGWRLPELFSIKQSRTVHIHLLRGRGQTWLILVKHDEVRGILLLIHLHIEEMSSVFRRTQSTTHSAFQSPGVCCHSPCPVTLGVTGPFQPIWQRGKGLQTINALQLASEKERSEC